MYRKKERKFLKMDRISGGVKRKRKFDHSRIVNSKNRPKDSRTNEAHIYKKVDARPIYAPKKYQITRKNGKRLSHRKDRKACAQMEWGRLNYVWSMRVLDETFYTYIHTNSYLNLWFICWIIGGYVVYTQHVTRHVKMKKFGRREEKNIPNG